MPKSSLIVNWGLVEEEMKKLGWSLSDLKSAASAENVMGKLKTACARSIDYAKAGRPVIKATVLAIARALSVAPPERLIVGYHPPESPTTTREIALDGLSPEVLQALEDVLPFLDKLRDAIKARDDVNAAKLNEGSLRITLEMSVRDAEAFDDALSHGVLGLLGIRPSGSRGYVTTSSIMNAIFLSNKHPGDKISPGSLLGNDKLSDARATTIILEAVESIRREPDRAIHWIELVARMANAAGMLGDLAGKSAFVGAVQSGLRMTDLAISVTGSSAPHMLILLGQEPPGQFALQDMRSGEVSQVVSNVQDLFPLTLIAHVYPEDE